MSAKKKPGKKPAISYRDLMAGKTEPPEGLPPDASAPSSDEQPTQQIEPQRTQRSAEEKPKGKKKNKSVGVTQESDGAVESAGTNPERDLSISSASSAASAVKKPEVADVQPPPAEPSAVKKPEVADVQPPAAAIESERTTNSNELPAPRELPPARRRDRSRELTPRELAAVLNVEQVAAARAKAEAAAAEARAAEAEILKAAQAAQAHANAGGAIALAESLNAAIIEEVQPRRSSAISSDTMEFAVASATATLPFRDRVRARAGHVEVLRFRVGTEFFAADLMASEEALERPAVHRVPGMPEQMLGVFSLRGRLIPVFSPTEVLGSSLASEFTAAIVLRSGERRIALAIDDVEDVMTLDLGKLRDIPTASDPEGVLLGIAWHGNDLVSLIDAEALLAACQAEQLVEMA
jgi:purine-binding chemotaxis protein CheW